ncbi:MAG: TonB-dependent receptor [Rhodothermales bacterium]|nr:TonB-dependent receptor [Rhodothermales bacterium]
MKSRPSGRLFLLIFGSLLFFSTPLFAQKGAITGVVVDAETGETLIGANVLIEGTATGTTTDFDGRYAIHALDAGMYSVVFSYIGYNSVTVSGVEVVADETVRVDITLSAEAIGLGEVIVEARAVQNTEASLLRERQKSISVSDAISAEAISRSGSGDAAGAMTKVTGASVVGGKYVYIRGLGERYSSTQLNGATLPSADPDKQAFQLDLFPTSLLDNIVTTKTFTPDKPGSFTGGLVNVGTKNFPDTFTLQFTTSSSYNDQSSLSNSFLSYDLGDLDWLGYDDGNRDIPAIFQDPNLQIPTEVEARFDPTKAQLLDNVSRAFRPEMEPTVARAPVNSGFSMAFGNQIPFLGRPLGVIASLTYNRATSFYDNGAAGRYELVGGTVQQIDQLTPLRNLVDTRGSQEANWGGVATLSYKPHPNHELSTTFLRTQNGTSDTRYLEGFWQDLSGNSTFQTRVLGYQERSLNSLQFKGEHAVRTVTAEWRASFATSVQDEPDLRYFSNHFTLVDADTVYQKPASLYPSPARFFRNLEEQNQEYGLDLSVPFKLAGKSSKVMFGGNYIDVHRDFNERRFEYRQGAGFSYSAFGGDNDAFFASTGIIGTGTAGRPTFGNYIIDASSLKSNYTGDQTISAGYAMADLLLTRKLRLIGGVRLEATRMTTQSADSALVAGRLENDDYLPSVNLVYALTDNMNLRAAATQTLARPTFRELAPYATFDFVGDFVFSGSSNLKRTLVTNYDLRWEWFVRPGEILAVSGFYKGFENPIERVIQTSVGNNTMSIQNVATGRVVGAEFEFRRRLDAFASILENFDVGGNLALVHSEVDIPEEELMVIRSADAEAATSRPLEGQSPFVVNFDLTYQKPEWGSIASIYYNAFGDRLRVVSEGAAPDIYERARGTVDIIYSQRIWRSVSLKFAVKNITDSDATLSQSFKDIDYVYQQFEAGRTYSLSFTYKVE